MMIGRMHSPRSVDLEITSLCNASCRYCYYLNNPGVDYHDRPTETWISFIEELGASQVMSVTLMGGEPLLRDDFRLLVDAIVANRMRFSLLTNGSLLTRSIATHLKATGRCDQVQVSLDGSTAAVHESLRGKGTFQPACDAIRLLCESGLPVTVRVTVHPGNLEDLPALARFLLEELALPSFSTNAAASLGCAEKYADAIFLKPAQRLRAMQLLAELESEYPGRILANAGPLADWHAYQEMEQARRDGTPILGRGGLVGCGCVHDRLAVRSDGAYVPCVVLPQMVLGHVGVDSLVDIWSSAAALTQLRERTELPLTMFSECRECPWRESCTGNCPGTALTQTGEINRPCPDACLKRFQEALAEEGLSLWT